MLQKLRKVFGKKSQPGIVFKSTLLRPIEHVCVKAEELFGFLGLAVKYGDREVMAVGTGEYDGESKTVTVTCLYPVLLGTGSSVTLTASMHKDLARTLDYWRSKPEVCIIHTHPHFSSQKSSVDDKEAIRMACLLFGGVAVMVIVDPFSDMGVDMSAYAIEPDSKVVNRIKLRLVP